MRRLGPALLVAAFGLTACGGDAGGPDDAGPSDFDGRTFVATSLTAGGQPHALVDGTELRLTFDDKHLGLIAGCNRLSGKYELDGERLDVTQMVGTDMGCSQPLMDQDAWLADVLAGNPRVRLVDDDLTLTAGDVVIKLTDR